MKYLAQTRLASILATSRRVAITASGLRLIESMPSSLRKRANSGKSLGAWPQMPILQPQRMALVKQLSH